MHMHINTYFLTFLIFSIENKTKMAVILKIEKQDVTKLKKSPYQHIYGCFDECQRSYFKNIP